MNDKALQDLLQEVFFLTVKIEALQNALLANNILKEGSIAAEVNKIKSALEMAKAESANQLSFDYDNNSK